MFDYNNNIMCTIKKVMRAHAKQQVKVAIKAVGDELAINSIGSYL